MNHRSPFFVKVFIMDLPQDFMWQDNSIWKLLLIATAADPSMYVPKYFTGV